MCFDRRTATALTLAALAAACDASHLLAPTADVIADLEPEWSAWTTPVNLGPVNSTSNDQHPSLSKDGLGLYFISNRPGGYGMNDIWVTQRATVDAPWGPPQNLGPAVNTAYNDFAPDLTIDGHRLYINSDRPGECGGSDLYVVRRQDNRDDFSWGTPENLGCGINTAYGEFGPTFFDDQANHRQVLYFTSQNRPDGLGDFDVYVSTRSSDEDAWGPGTNVTELNGCCRDTRTAISRDGLEMFLSSDVTGRPGGIGSQDLWASTRPTTADPWSAPVNLGLTVNSTAFDGAPALSFDGTELYFFSAKPGGLGAFDLYVTTRTRLRGQSLAHAK